MTPHPFADDCAAYLLDALDPESRAQFERHRAEGCEICEHELRSLSGAGRLLRGRSPSKPLTPRMRVAVLSEMGAGRTYSVRAAAGSWEPVVGGITLKRLFVDPRDGRETRLVRLQPGRHDLARALPPGTPFLVLDGALASGTETLVRGTWHRPDREEALWRVSVPTTLFAPGAGVFPPAGSAEAVGAVASPEAHEGERVLDVDAIRGMRTSLVRVAAGETFAERDHEGPEETLVLVGDVFAQGREYGAGDYLRTPDGGLGPASTRSGCRLVRVEHRPIPA